MDDEDQRRGEEGPIDPGVWATRKWQSQMAVGRLEDLLRRRPESRGPC